MKLLFDENLPPRLVSLLANIYPQAQSAKQLGLLSRPDKEVWSYARIHGFMIATKDVHFYRFCVSRGFPPKLVWVRTGNCSVHRLVETLQRAKDRIDLFSIDDEPFLILK